MPKKLISFRLDEEKLIKPLKKLAKREHRDLTNLIEVILLEFIDRSKK